MASKKSYLESLRRVSLFSSCSNKDLEKIAKAGDEVTMAAGSLVVDQGQTGRDVQFGDLALGDSFEMH
ncbi:MAG: hypothetical protein ACKO8T_08770, partial [Actinomycetota bacterium]